MPKQRSRTVRTTILALDLDALDWPLLSSRCHVARYQLPPKKGDRYYYPRMHNWYKQDSDFPCYLNQYEAALYVKYSHSDEVRPLAYRGNPLPHSVIDLQDEDVLPWLIKLLTADFFHISNQFVSNDKFFLRATVTQEFVTGLDIRLAHNYRENESEFIVTDQATRMRRLRKSEFEGIDDWQRKHRIYYGRFYTNGMAVFKQLKPEQLTYAQYKSGIFQFFTSKSGSPASLTFHTTKSLKALKQTRSYLLNQFMDAFTTYLDDMGIPARQKLLQMQSMHTMSKTQMEQRQLPSEDRPIYIIDDRFQAGCEPVDFSEQFCAVANEAVEAKEPLFAVKAEADLQPGDWALRLQDYDKDDFNDSSGILREREDGKHAFYARHPNVVKQTFNVNRNTELKQSDKKNPGTWSPEGYLDYPVPGVRQIGHELEVCRNQLLLKDVVKFPQDVLGRLPQAQRMKDTIFLSQETLVYFDGRDLTFIPVANNLDQAAAFIQEHTGWDLMDDILIPSANQYYYRGLQQKDAIEHTLKRPFLIGRDFVWEIWDEKQGRVVYEDHIIRERLEALETPRPIRHFYPPTPIQRNDIFTADQLQRYAQFLDEHVQEATIAYNKLKRKYGSSRKDERGRKAGAGFYQMLGIRNDVKFKRYLAAYHDLVFESVREGVLHPVYQGVWYDPQTNRYVAGVKDANSGEQERSHILRRIVVHRGDTDPDRMLSQLQERFFPLLEVNFIRHKNYTVIPFPFNLIDKWLAEQDYKQVMNTYEVHHRYTQDG